MKPYTITESFVPPERLVTFTCHATLGEIQRGAGLAKALNARSARAPAGWILTPARSQKWALLFDAGFEAYQYSDNRTRYRRIPTECKRLPAAVAAARELEEACAL